LKPSTVSSSGCTPMRMNGGVRWTTGRARTRTSRGESGACVARFATTAPPVMPENIERWRGWHGGAVSRPNLFIEVKFQHAARKLIPACCPFFGKTAPTAPTTSQYNNRGHFSVARFLPNQASRATLTDRQIGWSSWRPAESCPATKSGPGSAGRWSTVNRPRPVVD
jgi:hypothetical protein